MSSPISTHTAATVPDEVARVGELMATYGEPWALCGGWAVDAWLGKVTREHGDTDMAVFQHNLPVLFKHLSGWQMLAHDARWEPNDVDAWWDGRRRMTVPGHIHARPPERSGPVPINGIATLEDGFFLDIQVCEATDSEWLLSREPRIGLPLADCIRQSPWGLPTAVPEVLLYYKAYEPRQRDRRDFDAALPQLGDAQRAWLHDALTRTGHPWLPRLSG